jgi:S-adenosylmethionine decarboxylase proenzyme
LGRHILAEFFNCEAEILNDTGLLENHMKKAAVVCGATIVNSVFHPFNPHGVSGVVVIAESHLAIHTWPEYRFAAVDVFSCGKTVKPWLAIEKLKHYLGAQSVKTQEILRGELADYAILHHKPLEMR